MPEDLDGALTSVRAMLLDGRTLVRAVASGRRRAQHPRWRRVDLRPVDLKGGRHLQVVATTDSAPMTANHPFGDGAEKAVDELLAEPFGNWHVQTTAETLQLRVTKKGEAQVSRTAEVTEQRTGHDRERQHLIDPGDPLFRVLGAGAAKRRQVDAFLRALQPAVEEAGLPADRPLRVVDLGCGNAYLSFAAYRFLSEDREVRLTGVDLRRQSRERNTALATELGWDRAVDFVEGSILDAPVQPPVDVVLALHACDTATDDALAQALRWRAPVVLASPCCHHDLQRQMQEAGSPEPYGLVSRHGILRERLGDVLTDALRAALVRMAGYGVDVVQFVGAEHTPRNTMLRAVRVGDGHPPSPAVRAEYDQLVSTWGVTPYLQTLLADAGG
ncbi:MAG TPA: SAM-dependent methyltransferase [Actinomycetes bacterium]|nr:SAM-dependent methyltransferase [Actinomycetes bacterium]